MKLIHAKLPAHEVVVLNNHIILERDRQQSFDTETLVREIGQALLVKPITVQMNDHHPLVKLTHGKPNPIQVLEYVKDNFCKEADV